MERYRIVKDIAVYYITFTVVEWLPVFIDETACRIVTDSYQMLDGNAMSSRRRPAVGRLGGVRDPRRAGYL